jgi:hypothetical protein
MVGIVTQRPRPNYIFPLLLLLMAFTGLSARLLYGAVRRHWRLSTFPLSRLAPGAAMLLFILVSGRNGAATPYTPTLDDCRRLEPFKKLLTRKRGVFCTKAPHAWELGNFTGMDLVNKHVSQSLGTVLAKAGPDSAFAETLGAGGVTELFLKNPGELPAAVQAWRAEPALRGEWVKHGEIHFQQEDWEFWALPIRKQP